MSARTHPRLKLTEERIPEHSIQRTVAGVLRLEIGPEAKISDAGVTWFSIDHANNHGEVPGIRVGRGIPPGIFDMLVLYQGRAYWIELKSRDGIVSDPQRSMAATLLLSGCRIGVARDADEVLLALDDGRALPASVPLMPSWASSTLPVRANSAHRARRGSRSSRKSDSRANW